jgi:F-type H+-transporting ATPase subunit b
MAVDLAGRVVGESLEDVARQRRIVERFIEDLEQPQADEARSAT